jgi:hypothetical protein
VQWPTQCVGGDICGHVSFDVSSWSSNCSYGTDAAHQDWPNFCRVAETLKESGHLGGDKVAELCTYVT